MFFDDGGVEKSTFSAAGRGSQTFHSTSCLYPAILILFSLVYIYFISLQFEYVMISTLGKFSK